MMSDLTNTTFSKNYSILIEIPNAPFIPFNSSSLSSPFYPGDGRGGGGSKSTSFDISILKMTKLDPLLENLKNLCSYFSNLFASFSLKASKWSFQAVAPNTAFEKTYGVGVQCVNQEFICYGASASKSSGKVPDFEALVSAIKKDHTSCRKMLLTFLTNLKKSPTQEQQDRLFQALAMNPNPSFLDFIADQEHLLNFLTLMHGSEDAAAKKSVTLGAGNLRFLFARKIFSSIFELEYRDISVTQVSHIIDFCLKFDIFKEAQESERLVILMAKHGMFEKFQELDDPELPLPMPQEAINHFYRRAFSLFYDLQGLQFLDFIIRRAQLNSLSQINGMPLVHFIRSELLKAPKNALEQLDLKVNNRLLKLLTFLHTQGFQLDLINSEGENLAHLAVRAENWPVLVFLHQRGVPLNVANHENVTPADILKSMIQSATPKSDEEIALLQQLLNFVTNPSHLPLIMSILDIKDPSSEA